MVKYHIPAGVRAWRTINSNSTVTDSGWEVFKSSRSVTYTEEEVHNSNEYAISFVLPNSARPWIYVAFRRENITEEDIIQ